MIDRRTRVFAKYNLIPHVATLFDGSIDRRNNETGHDELKRGSLCLVAAPDGIFLGRGTYLI